jgi:putative transposase
MARTTRASLANYCYHVLNRGNARSQVFHKDADYTAFVELIDEACRRRPMRVLAYCLMPNHFHLVLWPLGDGDLSTWMGWLMNSHVRRYHRHYHSSGHIWQGRFKAFPIEEDEHLRDVLRYVERNPLRAGLVERAEAWAWSSLAAIGRRGRPGWLDPGPAPRRAGWVEEVNGHASSEEELGSLRRSVERGTPFGSKEWASRTAEVMGLESTIRARGRPRKAEEG